MDLNNDDPLKDIRNNIVKKSIKKIRCARKAKHVLFFNAEDYGNQAHTQFDQNIIEIIENSTTENGEISTYVLKHEDAKHLKTEAAKLKFQGAINNIDPDNILNVFTVFERCIKIGTTTALEFDAQDKYSISNSDIEKINVAAETALTSLFILTSPNIDSKLYYDDLLEEIISFSTYQIQKLIRPVFKETKNKNITIKKNNQSKKFFAILCHNISEIVVLLSELFILKHFTDNLVLKASTLGLSVLFSGIQDIELSSLKLLTSLFSRYQKHRKYIVDDIFSTLIENGNVLHPYILCSGEEIKLLTALFMLFIQSIISVHVDSFKDDNTFETLIIKAWNSAKETTFMFLHQFIVRVTKPEGKICRSFLDNLIQDLLLLLNNPDWPIAEIFLRALCIITPEYLNSSDLGLRSLATEFICNISYAIKKDMKSEINCEILDSIIKEYSNNNNKAGKKALTKYEKFHVFQQILLDYLASQRKYNLACSYARDFYLVQWYQANFENITSLTKLRMESKSELGKDKLEQQFKEVTKIQQFLRAQILNPIKRKPTSQNKQLTFERMKHIIKYLLSESKLYNYFNRILLCMVNTLKKNDAVIIRAKTLKGLSNIIDLDSKVLNNSQIEGTVKHLFFDTSPLIRESAIDLVGKFIIGNPEFIFTYYDSLVSRILDVSVSVRKIVVKILMDICIEYSDLPQIPEILLKIVCRITDEESIQNLVKDFFINIWFNPVKETPKLDEDTLVKKVWKIISTINQTNISSYEVLFSKIFRSDINKSLKNYVESTENVTQSCHQIVNCLIQTIVQLEKLDSNLKRLSSCMIVIALLTKYHPEMLIPHAQTLQNYLSIECKADEDYKIISSVAEIFTEIIPMMKQPSSLFLSQLEEDFVKLIMQQKSSVIVSSVTCLSQIFKITKNFKLLHECFGFYYKFIKETKQMMEQKKELFHLSEIKTSLNRSLFVVGLLIFKFDFNDPEISDNSFSQNFISDIIETVLYFSNCDFDTQLCVFKSLGFICSRYSELLLENNIKSLYTNNLTKEITFAQIKIQVLNNLEHFLWYEDNKFSKQNETLKTNEEKIKNLKIKFSKPNETLKTNKEKIKNLEDIHLGMASTIIQQYLDCILECLFSTSSNVRNGALKVIRLILMQGLIDPLQLMPYLIAMCTDENIKNINMAEKLLLDVEEKFPGYTYLSAHKGLQLSFTFQKKLTNEDLIRGWRLSKGHTKPNALNSFLYSQLKSRQHVRSFMLSLIKQFDEHSKISTEQMLYIADNLAYFPYKFLEELMYILYQIDTILSTSGSNMLQMFRENLLPIENDIKEELSESTDDENIEIEQSILKRFPKDITPLLQCIQLARGCQLLGMLKQHLRTMYNINLWKMKDYSPSSVKKGLVNKPAIIKNKTNCFIPDNIIKHMSTEVSKLSHSTLVKEYLNIKKLINALDVDNRKKRISIEDSKSFVANTLSSSSEVKIDEASFIEEPNDMALSKATNEPLSSLVTEEPPMTELKENELYKQITTHASSSGLVVAQENFPKESLQDIAINKSKSKNTFKESNISPLIKVSTKKYLTKQKNSVLLSPDLVDESSHYETMSKHRTRQNNSGRKEREQHFEKKINFVSSVEVTQLPEATPKNSLKEGVKENHKNKISSNGNSLKCNKQKISLVTSPGVTTKCQENKPKKSLVDCTPKRYRNKTLSNVSSLKCIKSKNILAPPLEALTHPHPQEVMSCKFSKDSTLKELPNKILPEDNSKVLPPGELAQPQEANPKKSSQGSIQEACHNKRASDEGSLKYFEQRSSMVPSPEESVQPQDATFKKSPEERIHEKRRNKRTSDEFSLFEQHSNMGLSPGESTQPEEATSKKSPEERIHKKHQNRKSFGKSSFFEQCSSMDPSLGESAQTEGATSKKSPEGKFHKICQNKRSSDEISLFEQRSSMGLSPGESAQLQEATSKKSPEERINKKHHNRKSSDERSLKYLEQSSSLVLSAEESAQCLDKRLSGESSLKYFEQPRSMVFSPENSFLRNHRNEKSSADVLSPLGKYSKKIQLSEHKDGLLSSPHTEYQSESAGLKQPQEILQGSLEDQILSKLKRKRPSKGNASPQRENPMKKRSGNQNVVNK